MIPKERNINTKKVVGPYINDRQLKGAAVSRPAAGRVTSAIIKESCEVQKYKECDVPTLAEACL